jgi:hypothetical protein
MKKVILIILGILLVAGVAGGGVWYWQKSVWEKERAELTNELNNLQKQISQQTVEKKVATTDLNCPDKYKKYISKKLGVGFCYPEQVGDVSMDLVVKVSESDNKIFVYYQDRTVESGQFIEVFDKEKNDTLTQAMEKRFLQEFSKDKCWASLRKDDDGVDMKPVNGQIFADGLRYPAPENEMLPFFANSDNCPIAYAATNGIRYFMMDENNPDRFFFFSIGQYSINGENQPLWQDTVKVFPKE